MFTGFFQLYYFDAYNLHWRFNDGHSQDFFAYSICISVLPVFYTNGIQVFDNPYGILIVIALCKGLTVDIEGWVGVEYHYQLYCVSINVLKNLQ